MVIKVAHVSFMRWFLSLSFRILIKEFPSNNSRPRVSHIAYTRVKLQLSFHSSLRRDSSSNQRLLSTSPPLVPFTFSCVVVVFTV